jgi:hypothetical protein
LCSRNSKRLHVCIGCKTIPKKLAVQYVEWVLDLHLHFCCISANDRAMLPCKDWAPIGGHINAALKLNLHFFVKSHQKHVKARPPSLHISWRLSLFPNKQYRTHLVFSQSVTKSHHTEACKSRGPPILHIDRRLSSLQIKHVQHRANVQPSKPHHWPLNLSPT